MKNKILVIALLICNLAGLILAIFWWLKTKEFEPAICGFASLGSLITLGIDQGIQKQKKEIQMRQKGGERSIQNQAARDIKINQGRK